MSCFEDAFSCLDVHVGRNQGLLPIPILNHVHGTCYFGIDPPAPIRLHMTTADIITVTSSEKNLAGQISYVLLHSLPAEIVRENKCLWFLHCSVNLYIYVNVHLISMLPILTSVSRCAILFHRISAPYFIHSFFDGAFSICQELCWVIETQWAPFRCLMHRFLKSNSWIHLRFVSHW